ncbi:hypothetical protein K431DRAFT_29724, partial [Polychaeton citri CBS 116435]
MPRAITAKDVGLKVLLDESKDDNGVEYDDAVDIVAVHGTGAHPDDTWCAIREPGLDVRDPNSYINWLIEPTMLPKVAPNARIMRYGYHSQWYGEERTKTSPSEIGQTLLLSLKHRRSECQRRPIIFVAHSFGGLAVISALRYAASSDDEPRSNIYKSTTGLVFFSTPFRGWGELVSEELLRTAKKKFGKGQVFEKDLRIRENGDKYLREIVDGYLEVVGKSSEKPKVACFYEQRPTAIASIVDKTQLHEKLMWVEESSGTLDIGGSVKKYSRDCDHLTMNKFWDPEQEAFLALTEAVEEMVKDGPKLLERRRRPLDTYRTPFVLTGIPNTDYFVERKAEMDKMDAAFPKIEGVVSRKVFVLYGTGGMGKTQLAANYARRQQNRFSAVIWLNGSSKDALQQSLASVVNRLPDRGSVTWPAHTPESDSIQQSMKAVFDWLSIPGNANWLLVYDNLDWDWQKEWDDISPQADQGNILITTRPDRSRKDGLCVGKVDNTLARRIIEERMGKQLQHVEDLLDMLQGLPLALVQAGAYLRTTNMQIPKYIQTYNETWTSLMEGQHRHPLTEYPDRSVLTTWQMSYNQVKSEEPKAAKLLDLWAFLSPNDIWDELATSNLHLLSYSSDFDSLSFLSGNENVFYECVRWLSQYSLVSADIAGTSHSIHPVVHAWSLHNVRTLGEEQLIFSFALHLVAVRAQEHNESTSRDSARRLVPHAKAVSKTLQSSNETNLTDCCSKIADFLYSWEKSEEVEKLYQRVLEEMERVWGPDHTSTLNTVNNLGNLYSKQGKMLEAEQMYKRALEGKEKAWG